MQKAVIHIQPVEAWAYYEENRLRLLDELVEIASDESTNTSVYMTDEDGFLYLTCDLYATIEENPVKEISFESTS